MKQICPSPSVSSIYLCANYRFQSCLRCDVSRKVSKDDGLCGCDEMCKSMYMLMMSAINLDLVNDKLTFNVQAFNKLYHFYSMLLSYFLPYSCLTNKCVHKLLLYLSTWWHMFLESVV